MTARPTVLITGATAGIGLAMAKQMSMDHRLILSGRREWSDCRAELPAGQIYIKANLGRPVDAADRLEAGLTEHEITKLDAVILNAGTGFYGAYETETADRIRQTLDVNLTSTIFIARRLEQQLRRAKGTLVLIGSVAHRGARNMPTYAASKAGLAGLARSLRSEWRNEIDVQIIHPGATATEMHDKAGFDAGAMQRLFFPPEAMADEIIRTIRSGKPTRSLSVGARLRRMARKVAP